VAVLGKKENTQKRVNNITGLCYCQDRFTSIA